MARLEAGDFYILCPDNDVGTTSGASRRHSREPPAAVALASRLCGSFCGLRQERKLKETTPIRSGLPRSNSAQSSGSNVWRPDGNRSSKARLPAWVDAVEKVGFSGRRGRVVT